MSPAKKLQERNQKAQQLKVISVDDEIFFVESSEGKICYKVTITDDGNNCTCADFVKNRKNNPRFACKHIMSVLGALASDNMVNGQILEKHKPKLDERFIMKIEGKEFCKYPGLLDLGHQKGISSIEVDILQFPTKENDNFAVCKATVSSENGKTFIDIGDCSPQNCNARVAKHLLRMASTRAIARALRSYTNIGMTCLEELSDISDAYGNNASAKSKPATRKRAPTKTRTTNSNLKTVVQPKTANNTNETAKNGNSAKIF